MVAVSSPASLSCAPAMVTVTAVSQFSVVKVIEPCRPLVFESVSTLTLALSLVTATVTSPVGSVLSTTVKVSSAPSVIDSDSSETVMPTSSSSVTVTVSVESDALS